MSDMTVFVVKYSINIERTKRVWPVSCWVLMFCALNIMIPCLFLNNITFSEIGVCT